MDGSSFDISIDYVRELERRQKVADSLRGILAVLNSNLPVEKILGYIVNQACPLLDADAAAIYQLQLDGILTIQSAVGLEKNYVDLANIPLGESATGQAVLSQKPVFLDDFGKLFKSKAISDLKLKKVVERLRGIVSSILVVPIIIRSEPYGALTLYYSKPHHFTENDVALAKDFTQHASLAIDNAQLRFESEQDAVFAERNRLARELHDSVTQNLFSANLIADVLPTIWNRDQQKGLECLQEIQLLTRGALAEMRSLLLELRPLAIEEAQLVLLLTQLVEVVSGRIRKNVDLKVNGQPLMPTEVKMAFYRIAQEALNNIVKHADADQIKVIVNCQNEPGSGRCIKAEMVIEDNGCGFIDEQLSSDHLGLNIMKERAEAINANIQIDSKVSCGTRIVLLWQAAEV